MIRNTLILLMFASTFYMFFELLWNEPLTCSTSAIFEIANCKL